MAEKVFLIHGWSVKETTTYQALHEKLGANGFDLSEIFLGRYVTLDNEVEIRDVSKALHNELIQHLGDEWNQPFHIITHSTGALVARHWMVHHYEGTFTNHNPLKNAVFLAGPQFGSRMAHHGRSMLAFAAMLGETGKKILNALELGSSFSWQLADSWLNESSWRDKGVRPYCIAGDKVVNDFFKKRIFPAHYEKGSDMVIRVPAANINFKRFHLDARTQEMNEVGSIDGIAFTALKKYTHSGSEHGIMNSITRESTPENHLVLKLILRCLDVQSDSDYDDVVTLMEEETTKTRKKRKPYAQLDFRFRDEDGEPIDDYVFKLGYIKNGRELASKTVAHTHKNKVDPSHFTVYINYDELEPKYPYFFEFDSRTDTPLVNYEPDPLRITADVKTVHNIIVENQTTQIDVTLSRTPERNLFIFHPGDDPRLHIKWNREGEITDDNLDTE